MNDDLVKRLRNGDTVMANHYMDEAADRIEELEAKLAKKDGNLEETYRRWKNGVDLRALAKAEGCTQERMRLKLKRYEEDKVRLLESKLTKAVERLEKLSRWLDLDDEELANLPIETLAEDHRHIQQQVNATLAELKGG